jgi:integrase
MPRIAKQLGALAVKNLKGEGLHAVGGVSGLYLSINPAGARSWILRTKVGSRRSDIGLGSYPSISLAMAHEKATATKEVIKQGVDPVADKKQRRNLVEWTFERCAADYIKLHRQGWTNAKHAQQWENTLATYAFPVIGAKHVSQITVGDVLAVIEPHWTRTNDTMVKVRNRIELVLAWAAARGYRSRENPAAWRGNLDAALPKPSKVNGREHHPSLPYAQVHDFLLHLRTVEGTSAKCLEFLIMTGVRSVEARGAKWDEFDFDNAVWTIPAERMKKKREHRIPLSDAALGFLRSIPVFQGNDFVFQGRAGQALSDTALNMTIKRMHKAKVLLGESGYLDPKLENRIAVVHGFRSTFVVWAAERTNHSYELREIALSHKFGNETQAAYQRGDLFERRRSLMNDWSHYLELPSSKTAKSVSN